jgi:hypothetical protein
MALAFEREKFFIAPTQGPNSQTESVTFPKRVRIAEVALQEFKFEYTGAAAPVDIVQVGAVVADNPEGTDTVQVKLSYHYSGPQYRGHAIVVVIADLYD